MISAIAALSLSLIQILTLEHDLQLSEMDRLKLSKEASNLRHQLSEQEIDRKSLTDEYVNLKTSYMSLTDDCEREVSTSNTVELVLSLVGLCFCLQ